MYNSRYRGFLPCTVVVYHRPRSLAISATKMPDSTNMAKLTKTARQSILSGFFLLPILFPPFLVFQCYDYCIMLYINAFNTFFYYFLKVYLKQYQTYKVCSIFVRFIGLYRVKWYKRLRVESLEKSSFSRGRASFTFF